MDNVACISICLHTETYTAGLILNNLLLFAFLSLNKKCVYVLILLPVCIFNFDLYPPSVKENRHEFQEVWQGLNTRRSDWPKVSLGRNSFGTQEAGTSRNTGGRSFVLSYALCFCFVFCIRKRNY